MSSTVLDTGVPMTQPSLSRRSFIRLVGGLVAGLVVPGCQPPERKPSTIQLVYQDWSTEWFPPMAQRMLEDFTASHPNIHVFYIPDPSNLEESMLFDMQAGTASDVFQSCCTLFPTLAQAGYTLDLRPYVEADLDQATIEDWDGAQYRSFFTPDGRQYGLPKYHGALALFYNKDLFDQYDVPYPDGSWDYDDYHEAMLALTHDQDDDGETDLWGSMTDISWDRLQIHANAWGGHFVDPDDPTRSLMSAPETLAALEWIRARMWDDRVMASFLDVQNLTTRQAFIQERVAMVEDGSWALRDILSESDFRVGVVPMPTGPDRRVTLATTDGFGIYAATQFPDEAWELLKFLISPEYGRAMIQAHFLQPARQSLVGEWTAYIQEQFPEKIDETSLLAFADGHIKGYSVTAEIFSNMTNVRTITDTAWEQIFTLGQGPVTLMEDVSRQIEAMQGG
jgi:multiple sugar transport system substrate-binding protein